MKKAFGIFFVIIFLLGVLVWYADATNPFSPFSIIKQPFSTYIDKSGNIQLKKENDIHYIVAPQILALIIDQLDEFGRIVPNRFFSEKPFKGNEEQIIVQIHAERFALDKPYIISAGHFGELYVRNFGVFYSSMLDGRFALSQKDWEDRQRVTLQTLAVDLELLKQAKKEFNVFFPVSASHYMGVNLYGYPSDSLFALVWTLTAATHNTFISSIYPANVPSRPLMTQQAGNMLLNKYKDVLTKSINTYLNQTVDPKSGLMKKNIPMSGARDEIIRQSSFYDNVIAWSTAKLAIGLGLQINCPAVIASNAKQSSSKKIATDSSSLRNDVSCDFDGWKQRIISAFWDDKDGIFLDDLSDDSLKNHLYSGDAFIFTSTQFLDFSKSSDREKIEREIAYVKQHHLDNPFPLQYAIKDQPERMYFFQRYFAPSYMGKTIWSHWGIEYIKTLILLSKYNPAYVNDAKKGLDAYANNIEKFGGFPELYDLHGNMYQTLVYKSLLHTGWVVNYEEAKMMMRSNLPSLF